MLAFTVEAALRSNLFEHVYVSTEDEEIALVALQYGADVHQRSLELAGDLVSATEVCLEVLDACVSRDADYEAVVCLQPSSPLRTTADVRGAWDRFCCTEADYLVSVTPIDPHDFHWAVRPSGEWWTMYFGEEFLVERPLLPPVYRPNGAVKIGRVDPLAKRRDFFGPRLATYEMPEERSVHVATRYELDLCEFLLGRS
jgi:CMP-N,N'-diacetyllegionaminic acid synthase